MRKPDIQRKGFQLQERDLAILRELFESRVMTTRQAAALHFAGSYEMAKSRLRILKTTRLVAARPRAVNEPAALHLTIDGIALLREHHVLADYPALSAKALRERAKVAESTLRHELQVMDVKAAFFAAARTVGVEVTEFTTWPRLCCFSVRKRDVKPDGYIRVIQKSPGRPPIEHAFFLEVDRGTESQGTLVSKAASYVEHYRRGGYATSRGAPPAELSKHPFRALFVFSSTARRDNCARRLLQLSPPILTQVYLATLEEVVADPLGAVWKRPADYRESKLGTIRGQS